MGGLLFDGNSTTPERFLYSGMLSRLSFAGMYQHSKETCCLHFRVSGYSRSKENREDERSMLFQNEHFVIIQKDYHLSINPFEYFRPYI
jgi:hypothetical protein